LLVAALIFVLKTGRDEREKLEDRLMALSKPEALIVHKAHDDPEPARVAYVDEETSDMEEYLHRQANGQPED
jgi:hypothetical protein